jgi:tetratricopeptide (TPR) repeat protein
MARNSLAHALCCGALALLAGASGLAAQMGALSSRSQAPQARSQQELDLYLKIVTDESPQAVLVDACAFAMQYPASELIGTAYQYQVHAYEQLGDFAAMLAAGRLALKAQPDNLNTLLVLAPAIANRMFQDFTGAELPGLAEEYAHRALEAVDKTHPPRQTPLEQWTAEKRNMQADVHEVLGLVALRRNQPEVAVNEMQAAVSLASDPPGSRYLRLGLAYAAANQPDEARKSLERAAQAGPEATTRLAQEQLQKLAHK